MDKREKARVPFRTLRELAPRALMILDRHKATDPTIALFESTLVSVTTAFMASFDATHSFVMGRPTKSRAQKKAVLQLWTRTNVWLAFLVRDLPSFDRKAYEADVSSAVRVIALAQRLLAFVATNAAAQQLSYVAQLTADISEALQPARQDWEGARASLSELQLKRKDTRTQGLAFERELTAFHAVLGSILGESNSDYQSLRVIRRTKPSDGKPKPSGAVQPVLVPVPNGADPSAAETRH